MTIVITLTLRSSNELRVDHWLVKAESQTKFDFHAKTRKRTKEYLQEAQEWKFDPIILRYGVLEPQLREQIRSRCEEWNEWRWVFIENQEPLGSFLVNQAWILALHLGPRY